MLVTTTPPSLMSAATWGSVSMESGPVTAQATLAPLPWAKKGFLPSATGFDQQGRKLSTRVKSPSCTSPLKCNLKIQQHKQHL